MSDSKPTCLAGTIGCPNGPTQALVLPEEGDCTLPVSSSVLDELLPSAGRETVSELRWNTHNSQAIASSGRPLQVPQRRTSNCSPKRHGTYTRSVRARIVCAGAEFQGSILDVAVVAALEAVMSTASERRYVDNSGGDQLNNISPIKSPSFIETVRCWRGS